MDLMRLYYLWHKIAFHSEIVSELPNVGQPDGGEQHSLSLVQRPPLVSLNVHGDCIAINIAISKV